MTARIGRVQSVDTVKRELAERSAAEEARGRPCDQFGYPYCHLYDAGECICARDGETPCGRADYPPPSVRKEIKPMTAINEAERMRTALHGENKMDEFFAELPLVMHEVRRILKAVQPSKGDKEDLQTYAKEVVRLREAVKPKHSPAAAPTSDEQVEAVTAASLRALAALEAVHD